MYKSMLTGDDKALAYTCLDIDVAKLEEPIELLLHDGKGGGGVTRESSGVCRIRKCDKAFDHARRYIIDDGRDKDPNDPER